jgi:hypothetical protein
MKVFVIDIEKDNGEKLRVSKSAFSIYQAIDSVYNRYQAIQSDRKKYKQYKNKNDEKK